MELAEGLGRLVRRFPVVRTPSGVENVEMTSNLLHHFPRTLPVLLHGAAGDA